LQRTLKREFSETVQRQTDGTGRVRRRHSAAAFGRRCTWRRRSATTACRVVRSPAARWRRVRASCYRPPWRWQTWRARSACGALPRSRGSGPMRWTRGCRRRTARSLLSRHAACRAVRCRDAPGVRVAWFPALRPTRLETRTKELSTRASRWASRTPVAQLRQNGRDPALACRRNAGPRPTRREWPRRKSACAQTRKVVNYA